MPSGTGNAGTLRFVGALSGLWARSFMARPSIPSLRLSVQTHTTTRHGIEKPNRNRVLFPALSRFAPLSHSPPRSFHFSLHRNRCHKYHTWLLPLPLSPIHCHAFSSHSRPSALISKIFWGNEKRRGKQSSRQKRPCLSACSTASRPSADSCTSTPDQRPSRTMILSSRASREPTSLSTSWPLVSSTTKTKFAKCWPFPSTPFLIREYEL